MIYSTRFTEVLDACVLYPAPVRDLFLNLAEQELYQPKWSEIIQEEWMRNLLKNRPDLTRSKLLRTVRAMNIAFPEAEVHSFEELIDRIELPDPNDRHVVAAGIAVKADAIITFNKKDFPIEYMSLYDLVVYEPDAFVRLLYDQNEMLVKRSFDNQLASLKNPQKTRNELVDILAKCGLVNSSKLFR